MAINPFNIRVYGLLIVDDKLLVTDEYRMGQTMTKLPGGGLQFGEGLIDCLIREFKEELNIAVNVEKHLYTSDFFQPSAFNPKQQIISIYYLINTDKPEGIVVKQERNSFDEVVDEAQVFRWIKLSELTIGEFTFPIDQKVASILIEQYK